jgi:site-specific recombinase XerD
MTLSPAVAEVVRGAIGDRTFGTIVLNSEGNPYTPNSLWRMIKRLSAEAGLDPNQVSPHTLRRTCARTATMLGVPLNQTQELLRHEDPATTLLYVGKHTGMENLAGLQVSSFYSSLLAG